MALNGHRLPVGFNAARDRGPFTASWSRVGNADVWTAGDVLVDVQGHDGVVLTVSGGGLTGPRTLSIDAGAELPGGQVAPGGSWSAAPDYLATVKAAQLAQGGNRIEAQFFGRVVPVALLIGALLVLARAWQIRRRARPRQPEPAPLPPAGAEPATHAEPLDSGIAS
jgi:high-affinity iron transporter